MISSSDNSCISAMFSFFSGIVICNSNNRICPTFLMKSWSSAGIPTIAEYIWIFFFFWTWCVLMLLEYIYITFCFVTYSYSTIDVVFYTSMNRTEPQIIPRPTFVYESYNQGKKLSEQLRKTELSLKPQAINIQPIKKTIRRECKRTLLYL